MGLNEDSDILVIGDEILGTTRDAISQFLANKEYMRKLPDLKQAWEEINMTRGVWTETETGRLKEALPHQHGNTWSFVASTVESKNLRQCVACFKAHKDAMNSLIISWWNSRSSHGMISFWNMTTNQLMRNR
jgi:hypothetical protein